MFLSCFLLIIGLIRDKIEPEYVLYENKILPEVSEGTYFDQSKFLSDQCAPKYDKYLGQTVIRENEVFFDKVEEKEPKFFSWLRPSY